jgi:hypothetical protein
VSDSDRIKNVQGLVDDLVRGQTDEFVNEVSEDVEDAPTSLVLGDWILVTHWLNPENNTHWYHELRSQGLSPHAQLGLLHQTLEQR